MSNMPDATVRQASCPPENTTIILPTPSGRHRFGNRMKSFFKSPSVSSQGTMAEGDTSQPVESGKPKSLSGESPGGSISLRDTEFHLFAKHIGSENAFDMFQNEMLENLVQARVLMADKGKNFNDAIVRIELLPKKPMVILHTQTSKKVEVQIEAKTTSPSVKRESLGYWSELGSLQAKNGKVPPTPEFLTEVENFVVVFASNFAYPVTIIFDDHLKSTAFVRLVILLQMFHANTKRL